MFRVKLFLRFVVAALAVTLPFVLLSIAFFQTKGMWIGLSIGLSLVIGLSLFSEALVTLAFKDNGQEFKGLERSLNQVIKDFGGRVPALHLFPDPIPDVLSLRSWGGKGTILLSQGIVGMLSEEELRVVMRVCVLRIRRPGAVLQGFCSVLVTLVMALSPKPWVDLIFSGRPLSRLEGYLLAPLSSIGFIVFYPVIRFFIRLGRLSKLQNESVEATTAYLTAKQKVIQAVRVLGIGRSQRAFSLFFVEK